MGKVTAIAMAQAGVAGLVLFARSDLSATKDACLASQRAGQSLRVLTFAVDIANNEHVVAAVNKAGEVFGRLDIVINNAAQVGDYNLIADSDAQKWWGIWDINLRGAYHVVRAVLPLLIRSNGDKTIINVASYGAVHIAPTISSYCVKPNPTPRIFASDCLQICRLRNLRFCASLNLLLPNTVTREF